MRRFNKWYDKLHDPLRFFILVIIVSPWLLLNLFIQLTNVMDKTINPIVYLIMLPFLLVTLFLGFGRVIYFLENKTN
ncbi:hypothetical protein LCGC14_2674230 [marine sediment metagenome]|uniref:Uncharacterized protein n=1 Tax=marine sediment metagenome TaxID=412755 RepID=A0A0F9CF18_9ZZZZ